MGIELLGIGIKMREVIIFTVRGCYRSVCNHPFLVGMLCFLIFLYRSCPVIFSLLVSASPVLVCTAVLLGTLLSYGQPNLPEIEIEEKTTHESGSLKVGVSGDANAMVVEKNESHYVERYNENKSADPERVDLSFVNIGEEIRREGGLDDTAPLIEERSREVELDGGDLRYEHKTEWNEENEEGFSDEEVVENKYASVPNVDDDEHLELDDDEKAETDSFDSERVNVDSLDSPPRSPWKRIEEREEEEEEEQEDEVLDSESDRAESSSPDASMADIMPMLDELHPLLDEDAPQPIPMSRDGSPRSRTDGHDESDDGSENHDDLDGQDDDNEDDHSQGDKEEQTKSAITWTEEDQKNLMDLGSSEIERNIRLENLIMRRRARKNMSIIPERNLIDLESSDLPFNIAPITTRRRNPFDTPHDSYDDNSGLPPIPGSAPSILLPRRNPFDIPYDSSEEKPDHMGDGFQEEFTRNQSRDPFFRRHESFNVRPSVFAPNRRDVKMRPYFVPEGTVSEESSYSSFRRQLSELSDYSKVSSVPETESIVSVEDLDDRKLDEEHNHQELEEGQEMKGESEVGPSRDSELISQEVTKEDIPREFPEHVGHGSQYSEEEDSSKLSEKEYVLASRLGDVSEQENETLPVKVETSGNHSNSEAVEQRHSRDSSSSSLSEVSERVFTMTEGDEGLSILDERRDFVAEEPIISAHTSVESTTVDEIPHREPVYDLSPRELRKNFSSSSISSDVLAESDLSSPLVSVNRTVTERESELSILDPVDEHESGPSDDPLKSSLEASVEENLVEQHRDVDIHTLIKLSEDENRVQTHEETNLVIRQGEPPFEGRLTEDHSVDINETVQSPNSDADVHHGSNEKLISPSSAEGNSYLFYDDATHEPTFKHLDEVQVSNTSFESSEDVGMQNSNMPEIQELNHDIPSNINSPLSPDFISVPSTSFETTISHVDVQTIVEELDEIKEIDEELLSELDNVGDFSIISSSNVFEKHTDYVEVNKIENQIHTDNLKEQNEAQPAYSVVSQIDEDTTSGMAEFEAKTLEEIDLALKLISDEEIEKPIFLEPSQSELASETGLTHETSILEFRPIEDASLDNKEVNSVHHILHVVEHGESRGSSSELHVEEPVHEERMFLPPEKVVDGKTEEEVKPSFEDVSLEIEKDKEISVIAAEKTEHGVEAQGIPSELYVEEPVFMESTLLPPENVVNDKTEEEVKPNSDDVSVEIKKDKEISGVASEQAELKVEAQEISSELSVAEPVSKESMNLPPEEVIYGKTEEEVKPNSDDQSVEIKKDEKTSAVASEGVELQVEPQGTSSELLDAEPISKGSTNMPLEEVVDGNPENQVRPNSENASVEFKKDEEISVIAFERGTSSDVFVVESVPGESTNCPSEEVVEDNTEKLVKPNSDDVSLEIKKDNEISAIASDKPEHKVEAQETSSELLVVKSVPRESTDLPLEKVVDGDTQKLVRPTSEEVSPEIEKEKEISVIAAEKPKQEVESPQELHSASSVKGKGDVKPCTRVHKVRIPALEHVIRVGQTPAKRRQRVPLRIPTRRRQN
ncbi:hypothetical protein BUALT_Bualt12G0046100 [Buddleja alternifolia]|uniref:Uncharacterized protein n=1 Tax=Buddleja alternifolia TaxID=168488 RepID=A0AAV6WX47_9LAMI|nr:hypothetical protein BUALT_Bualt12G0046100 [Buddleja alternifolia]